MKLAVFRYLNSQNNGKPQMNMIRNKVSLTKSFRVAAFVPLSIFLLVVSSSVFSCAADVPVHIGVLLDDSTGRWQNDSKLIQSRARELGARITVKDARGNDDLQLQQARQLLDAGATVLIVVPHHSDKAAAIVQAAQQKRVPVISYDRLIRNSPVSLYISFDNIQVGKLQASALLTAMPHGNYFLLEGAESDNNAHQFERGQKLVLGESADRIKIVDETWCRHWTAKEAYDGTVTVLKKTDGKITAIVAANDDTAAGAIQALAERKMAGTIPVSGQDANLAAILRI